MSSLGKFWDTKNKFSEQKDMFEGVCAVTRNEKNTLFPIALISTMSTDLRFRIEAYKYCNLLCLYRVERDDVNHIMQEIPARMNKFGDSVLVIKNHREFIKRVKDGVIKKGGIYCMGDVHYHRITSEKRRPGVYYQTAESKDNDGTFPLETIDQFGEIKGRYGCLDKYIEYSNQKEWRVCYLPTVYDTEDTRLSVGDLRDIVDVYPSTEVREELLTYGIDALNPKEYVYGTVDRAGEICDGIVTYDEFKEAAEKIDGKCRMIISM